jgi:hypothetical protein
MAIADAGYKDPFELARLEWQRLSKFQSWIHCFGDLYVRRFPIMKMSETASQVSSSILEGDDSVHAYNAEGVRSTIIKRIIEGEKRGFVRPWYSEAGLWAENSNILKAFSEQDLHYVVMENFRYPENSSGEFSIECAKMVKILDPDEFKNLPFAWEQVEYEYELNILKYELFGWLRPQIEFFAVFKGLERSLYPFAREEFDQVANLLLDPEMADVVLRKRFYDPNEKGKKVFHPLIGEGHTELSTHKNFVVKYIGVENKELYTRRAVVLWIFSLLMNNDRAKSYMYSKGALLFDEIHDYCEKNGVSYNDLIWQALEYAKLDKIFSNFSHTLRTEYASRAHFSSYASDLFHLLHQRKRTMTIFESYKYPIEMDTTKFEETNFIIELGQKTIDSIIFKLQSQIPIPKGVFIHQRAIMMKRKNNLEREVAPASLRQEIIEKILEVSNYTKDTDVPEIEKRLRYCYDKIMPRGQKYFEEMETRMAELKADMGTVDMAEEYSEQMDNPQSLVRQFGPEATRLARQFFDDPANTSPEELYGLLSAMKSVQLLFDEATINTLKKNNVTDSLMKQFFMPQIDMSKKIKKSQDAILSIIEAEKAIESAKASDAEGDGSEVI